jgi:hypothetical protein
MDVYQRRRLVALSGLAALFIVIVLLIRSCGGDDEQPTAALTAPVSGASGATGAVLSQDDYIAEADDICLQANTALSGVDESDAEQAASDKGQILSGELEQLQTLSAPEKDSDTLNKFLSALRKEVQAYGDQATAAQRGDDATVAELDTTIAQFADKAQTTADKYGFDVCGDTTKVDEGDAGGGGGTETTPTATTPSSDTDTGGTVAPVAPTPTTPEAAPTPAAPTDQGGATPVTPAPAPTDGGTDTGSGGVTP